jgi:fumarate hydratase class II
MDRTGLSEADLLTNPHVAIGSVDAVCEKILALREDLPLREAAKREGVAGEDFDAWVRPEAMLKP